MDKTTEEPILIYSVTYHSTYWLLLYKDMSKAQGTYYSRRAYSEQRKYPRITRSLMPMMPDRVNSSEIEWTLGNDPADHSRGPWCFSRPEPMIEGVNPWSLRSNLDAVLSNVRVAVNWLRPPQRTPCNPLNAQKAYRDGPPEALTMLKRTEWPMCT